MALWACASLPVMAAPVCVRIDNGWMRLPPGPMSMAAGYARIHNDCAEEVVVVGAGSRAFDEVSLHQTTLVDGVSRMREISRLPVAAGTSVQLQPGGLHLMLMRPEVTLREGAQLPVRLSLEDGRKVDGSLQVRSGPPSRP